ncbi:Prefoldin chaperone subunit family protein [Rhynchospora pubera]|uniref:Prefoldin chaperone subunit family protein n=1 Tax=Rhynchospora pubera TaxID=906938 RepID=A0AAV8EA03_9POAL|nr:Prefoldin chaperone subunit family protein [Rhynchospora pubera]
MAAASSSSPPLSASISKLTPLDEQELHLLKEVKGHEVAISELNSISSSRAVYQKSGNIFFRKSVKSAIAVEQKQLDLAKAQLEKQNAAKFLPFDVTLQEQTGYDG